MLDHVEQRCRNKWLNLVDRPIAYQNRLFALVLEERAPRDYDVRQGIGRLLQKSLLRGEKVSGRWRGEPVALDPPFLERRQNPPLQRYTRADVRGAAVLVGALVLLLVIAERAARAASLMP